MTNIMVVFLLKPPALRIFFVVFMTHWSNLKENSIIN